MKSMLLSLFLGFVLVSQGALAVQPVELPQMMVRAELTK